MNQYEDLLIEIGVEEIPYDAQITLSKALETILKKNLSQLGLTPETSERFSSPRRLAVLLTKIPLQQADQLIVKKGPSVSAAFDESGKPTAACLGFLKSCQAQLFELKRHKTEQGEWLVWEQHQKGKMTLDLLPQVVEESLSELPMRKPMRWGDHLHAFVRPIHWLVVLLGTRVPNTTIFGIVPQAHTYGHRYLYPGSLPLSSPRDYPKLLIEQGFVLPSFEERKAEIRRQLQLANSHTVINPSLLEEVTGLVEWPCIYQGSFDAQFLDLPREVLISVMEKHQRYFAIEDERHHLTAHFLLVSNLLTNTPAAIIQGNEKVMKARLTDAEFFYQQDTRYPLSDFIEKQKAVSFHRKLGSLHEKSLRISQLSQTLAAELGQEADLAREAGLLSKADLLSAMVNEFPELQGIMGYYYALKQNESRAIAVAIKEAYLPRFSGDNLPETPLGQIVALSDRVDTLIGLFGISQAPTGDKDPFGLRRAALGIVRILIEKALPVDLKKLLEKAFQTHSHLSNLQAVEESLLFIIERLKGWYQEQGIASSLFAAVWANYITIPDDFHRRLQALQSFCLLPEASSLITAHKRASHLLEKNSLPSFPFTPSLAKELAERQLAEKLSSITRHNESLIENSNYSEVLNQLCTLTPFVDQFFNDILVDCEPSSLKDNRLALLSLLVKELTLVGDLSKIVIS